MPRQRFIWPSLWADKDFGVLKPDEQVLFIALWSLADDEGRISAEPALLKSRVFPFKTYTTAKVRIIRDQVVTRMRNVRLYQANGEQYIALLKWGEYQKPKYPSPSKIPAPFPEDSGNVGGELGEGSPMGWVGSGLKKDLGLKESPLPTDDQGQGRASAKPGFDLAAYRATRLAEIKEEAL